MTDIWNDELEKELKAEQTRLSKEFNIEEPTLFFSDKIWSCSEGRYDAWYINENRQIVLFKKVIKSVRRAFKCLYHEFKHHLQNRDVNWNYHEAFSHTLPHDSRPHEIEANIFALEQLINRDKRLEIALFMTGNIR